MRRSDFSLEGDAQSSPPSRRSGRKPDRKRVLHLAEIREIQEANAKRRQCQEGHGIADPEEGFDLPDSPNSPVDSEWGDDSDWEYESRAEAPVSGAAMDGYDVGCTPSRNLQLPRPQMYLRVPTYGRSMLTSNFDIPTVQ